MKALILDKAKEFHYEERLYPRCGEGTVTVRMDAVCICGSDVHAILGRQPLFSFPRVIGHEAAGTVVEAGQGVSDLKEGDQVCLMPCISCKKCRACEKGQTNACKSLELYGVHRDGSLQEYLNAPAENWIKISVDARPEEIAMLEPLTIGCHAAAKLGLKPGDRVLVMGAGPIGVSCALNAKTYGAEVILADISAQRRRFVSEQFELDVLDPVSYDYNSTIQRITEGQLFDAVVDTTAVKSVMENDWRQITQGGKLVFAGICKGVLEIPGEEFHMKEPSVFVTRNSTKADFERVIDFWKQGILSPGDFITHRTSFEEAGTELLKWTAQGADVFKGVVRF